MSRGRGGRVRGQAPDTTAGAGGARRTAAVPRGRCDEPPTGAVPDSSVSGVRPRTRLDGTSTSASRRGDSALRFGDRELAPQVDRQAERAVLVEHTVQVDLVHTVGPRLIEELMNKDLTRHEVMS